MKITFYELPIGARFEFRGRRYEKLALDVARDEERGGNVFHAGPEVLAEIQSAECMVKNAGAVPTAWQPRPRLAGSRLGRSPDRELRSYRTA